MTSPYATKPYPFFFYCVEYLLIPRKQRIQRIQRIQRNLRKQYSRNVLGYMKLEVIHSFYIKGRA